MKWNYYIRIPPRYYVLAPAQCILGSLAWFYVFAVALNDGIAIHTLLWPIAVAVVGAIFVVSTSAIAFSASPLVSSMTYSCLFWFWAYLQWGDYRSDHRSNSLWVGIAVIVHMVGLAGGYVSLSIKKGNSLPGSSV
jgi:hypothetical protein